jgi:5-(carboxyamino)imidazole ribonucleotide mutase
VKAKTQVVVVMGSRSDLPVMKEAGGTLESFGIKTDTVILSAHRTPHLLKKSIEEWESSGVDVIIAGAGGAAHLPGMLASFSVLPIIGVPIKSASLNGLDALLSIAQMPSGVPVATVAINNSKNAALLAIQILSLGDKAIEKKFRKYKEALSKKVEGDRKKLSKLGIKEFLRK